MKIFIKFNENLRKDNDFSLTQVANMDETPLFINMAVIKIIVEIWSKEVNIKTHSRIIVHVTAILWIVADGTKLPLMLLFKGNIFWMSWKKNLKANKYLHMLKKLGTMKVFFLMDYWRLEKVHSLW